jgi:hypothetical protein
MIVLWSTFKKLENKFEFLESKYYRLLNEYTVLVREINRKGGRNFLDNARLPALTSSEFTQEDIKRLIQLCHPDKHNNSTIAKEITAKLLKHRK